MKYTIDNPKLIKWYHRPEEDNFTGVLKDKYDTIVYYENGKRHRIDGPAILWGDGAEAWYIHGKCHREDGPAFEHTGRKKEWFYNGKYYGKNDDFTIESWTKKCKLEVFK